MITTFGNKILIHNLFKLIKTSLKNALFSHVSSQKSKMFNIKFHNNQSKLGQGRFHQTFSNITSSLSKK